MQQTLSLLLLTAFTICAGAITLDISSELHNMYRLDLLPAYREGVVEQFSSYDYYVPFVSDSELRIHKD